MMNNLTNKEERKKEDKQGVISAMYILISFPILFGYYGFLIWIIQKKKKYDLDISISDMNLHIGLYCICISVILSLLCGLLRKLSPKFENGFWNNFILFINAIFMYIAMGAGFTTLWLVNL